MNIVKKKLLEASTIKLRAITGFPSKISVSGKVGHRFIVGGEFFPQLLRSYQDVRSTMYDVRQSGDN